MKSSSKAHHFIFDIFLPTSFPICMPHATPSLKSTSSTPLLSMKVPETETAKWEQREGESERERPTQRQKDEVKRDEETNRQTN